MTKRYLKWLALVAILGLVAAACGGDGAEESPTPPETETTEPTETDSPTGTEPTTTEPTEPTDGVEPGGTVNVLLLSELSGGLDINKSYYTVGFSFFRCCLARTLMTFPGAPVEEGGGEPLPDLAAEPPVVSADGLSWTFTLKPDIAYGPPLDGVTVKSEDIVRAIEREACATCAAGGYSFYFSDIVGFDEFAAGDADTIEGLATPDDTTLEVTLERPAGDLPLRFTLPATSPIPPNPDAPNAPFGIAEGHDKEDLGRWWVSTGPYMIEGADALDFSVAPAEQAPVSGYENGRILNLVRNPNWDPATDSIRPAYVDEIRMEFTTASEENIYAQIERGDADWTDAAPPTDVLQRYSTDPDLAEFFHVAGLADTVRYIEINLAEPPFDDIHVRKALNLATDKAGLIDIRGGPLVGEVATHNIVDTLLNNLLEGYDPYETPNSAGDVEAAKEEMRQSKYDTDGDGECDDPVCKNVLAITDESFPYPEQADLLRQNYAPIGITMNVRAFDRSTMYARCSDPKAHVALCLAPGWAKDFSDAVTFGPPLFGSAAIGPEACCNRALVGASPEVLQEHGYEVTEVPSADEQMDQCVVLEPGDARFECWAGVDRFLMEDIVPWVPYMFDIAIDIVSPRIVNYTFDSSSTLPAWEVMGVTE